jgi:hypothetical protein
LRNFAGRRALLFNCLRRFGGDAVNALHHLGNAMNGGDRFG